MGMSPLGLACQMTSSQAGGGGPGGRRLSRSSLRVPLLAPPLPLKARFCHSRQVSSSHDLTHMATATRLSTEQLVALPGPRAAAPPRWRAARQGAQAGHLHAIPPHAATRVTHRPQTHKRSRVAHKLWVIKSLRPCARWASGTERTSFLPGLRRPCRNFRRRWSGEEQSSSCGCGARASSALAGHNSAAQLAH